MPITEADIPNVYVSVLLIRGRTSNDPGADGSDPGKPAFRLGYAELVVDDDREAAWRHGLGGSRRSTGPPIPRRSRSR